MLGKVRYIGITGFPLEALQYVIENDKSDCIDTILSYCHYALNNTTLTDLVPLCKAKNIGIINAGALSSKCCCTFEDS